MEYRLGRFGVGESIGKAMSIIIDNLPVFLLTGTLVGLASRTLTPLLESLGPLGSFGSSLLATLTNSVYTGVVARFVAGKYLRPDSLAGDAAKVIRSLPLIMAAAVLVSLAVMGGLILLVIPGIIFSLGFYFSTTIVAVEELGPVAAMKRSWRLTKGHRGDVFGLNMLLILIAFAVMVALEFLGRLVSPVGVPGLAKATSLVTDLLSTIITGGMTAAASTVFYLGLRTAEEGLEAERIAVTFDLDGIEGATEGDPGSAGS